MSTPAALPRSRLRKLIIVSLTLAATGLLSSWAVLAIYFSNLPGHATRTTGAAAFALGTVFLLLRFGVSWNTVLGLSAAFLMVALW